MVDTVGLVTKAALPYLLGDRTLIKDVRRAPWMCEPAPGGAWRSKRLPLHGHSRPDPDTFTKDLYSALLNEARGYLDGAHAVGILLSGGMDSRVLAGVVRALQEEGGAFSVVGLTWGQEGSRDVIYANRITERFGWDWRHFPMTAETLSQNIAHMARLGAESSPLHLHAMPQVAELKGLDVVLAGTYGDSVGRAEFSGRHVTALRPILPTLIDRFGVVRFNALAAARPGMAKDRDASSHLTAGAPSLRTREIERQLHYLRRMMQFNILCIAPEKRVFQLFTAPEVFGRMWSLDPVKRDNDWYHRLLLLLPGNLLDIPWARTGRRYLRDDDIPDRHSRPFHNYGQWLRRELRQEVLARVNSPRIRELGIFNNPALDSILGSWGKASTITPNSLDELVAWLASLHDFIELYQVDTEVTYGTSASRDWIRAFGGGLHASLYIKTRERLRY
jgi:hypothetical protein